jgi:D-sedoheptulose 7-phosphate isomerase
VKAFLKTRVKAIFDELFQRYPALEICRAAVAGAFDLLQQCYAVHGKVLACGNGGSAADAEHIVGELMKGFLLKRKLKETDLAKIRIVFPMEWQELAGNLQGALPAISLVGQSPLITAFCNDVTPDMAFAQQVYGYGRAGDLLIGLTTSGNSKNVLNALKIASSFGIKTIGFTGENGGLMKELADVTIRVPAQETFKVQEYHLPVYHTLCAMVESEFFGE